MTPPFQLWSLPHLMVIGLTIAIPLLAAAVMRSNPDLQFFLGKCLAVLLLVNWGVNQWVNHTLGMLSLGKSLPLHVCDLATILLVCFFFRPRQKIFEVLYFWGLGGTLQAVITPDLQQGFPHPKFFTFFIGHSGIIIGILYAVWGIGWRPHRGSITRAWIWILVYAAAVGLINVGIGTNYGYLLRKPAEASLMDHLGPWPWYIVSLIALSWISFCIYYAPFWIRDRFCARLSSHDEK